ncbi:MAG: esterase, partial [Planctomycetes bacterium RBG_16_64_10]
VIYGRKFGTALTMDVFTPAKNANRAGVVFVVSGGWFSDHQAVSPVFLTELLQRGYTVFAVVHGSQPKFTIPEIVADMHRAIRFVRFHADQYGVDPNRLGITGLSAGGHLSLMQGTGGDLGNPASKDPIDRVPSRVQAVACFCPPTDFLNYGKPGENAIGRGVLKDFKAPFDFAEFDPQEKRFRLISDEEKIVDIGRSISPISHVTADDPPTLIIHGDADQLVPIQQAQMIIARLQEVGVPAKLVIKPGAQHGWKNIEQDMQVVADWFDEHLAKLGVGQKSAP